MVGNMQKEITRPIKICHMTSVHDSNDIRIFQKECLSIAKNPLFDVTLVAPGDSRVEHNVNVIGVGERPSNRLKRTLCFTKRVFKQALEVDADIYHFHDPELLRYGLKLKRKGKKVIFDSHEYTYAQIMIKSYIPLILRKIIARIYKHVEENIISLLDAVIFPCTYDGKHPFENIAKRTEIIGNLPNISLFNPNTDVEKKFDVCCTGSLTEARGITELLKAAQMAKAKVALAGTFSPHDYQAILEKQGLFDRVSYFGNCEHEEVISIIKESKICVSNIQDKGQYSKIDNMPTKVYEAMAMQIPVIISDFSYPRSLNQKLEFSVLINPQDVESLAQAITKLCCDQELRRRLGDNGRILVEKYFNWAEEVKKLEQLYLSINDH